MFIQVELNCCKNRGHISRPRPQLETAEEAGLWRRVFLWAEAELGLGRGSVRACVLIENVLATFQMEEILWELRDHSAGDTEVTPAGLSPPHPRSELRGLGLLSLLRGQVRPPGLLHLAGQEQVRQHGPGAVTRRGNTESPC